MTIKQFVKLYKKIMLLCAKTKVESYDSCSNFASNSIMFIFFDNSLGNFYYEMSIFIAIMTIFIKLISQSEKLLLR